MSIKEFDYFNGHIPDGEKAYFLLRDGDVLEVDYDREFYDNPFITGHAYGKVHDYDSYGYSGTSRGEAIDKMEENVCTDTMVGIDQEIAAFLLNDMKTTDFIGDDGEPCKKVVIPSVQIDTVVEGEDAKLDNSKLFSEIYDYVMDNGRPVGGAVINEMTLGDKVDFCKENNIDISDHLLIADTRYDYSQTQCAVIMMDINDMKEAGFDMFKLDKDQRERVLNEQVRMFDHWANGDVYQWTSYDLSQNVTDFASGYFGPDEIRDAVNHFDYHNTAGVAYDLGSHRNIEECIETHRDNLERFNAGLGIKKDKGRDEER